MQIANSNVNIGRESIESLVKGFMVGVNSIKPTYGPNGVNACIESDLYPFAVTANDAQTVIQAIKLTDPVEKRGLGYLKELMDRIDSLSADGRKTTALIAGAILEQAVQSGMSGMELKRELDALIPVVEAKIDEQKHLITENDVEAVATIASESKRIGALLGSIYKVIGKDGIIHLEGSGTYQDDTKFIEGVRFFDTGFLSPYLVRDEEAVKDGRKETRAVYENPLILVTKRKIANVNDINPLLMRKEVQDNGLVIFTDDMDSTVAAKLVEYHKEKKGKVLIIKAPILWKQYVFEDFAKITGATIVEDASGVNFKNLQLSHLGTCGKITTDKDETTVVGIADISSHIKELEEKGDNDSKLRLSWLQTKTAILKLGANSESELSYLRLKTSDAINSSRLALKDGVVKGGGVCLFNVAEELDISRKASEILKKALLAPHTQLMLNKGNEEPKTLDGVVDASLVVKNAVRNAVSLASTILTLGVVIHTPPMSEQDLVLAQLSNKRPY